MSVRSMELRASLGTLNLSIGISEASKFLKCCQNTLVHAGRSGLVSCADPIIALFRSTNLQQAPMISIVDDDFSVREAAKCLIRSLGYDAMTFSSAEEFLESGRVQTTACLISDIHMPGLSGVELQERLITNGYCLPIIFVTAYPDEKLRGRLLRGGAIGYLSKPFNEDRLIECLGTALKNCDGSAGCSSGRR